MTSTPAAADRSQRARPDRPELEHALGALSLTIRLDVATDGAALSHASAAMGRWAAR